MDNVQTTKMKKWNQSCIHSFYFSIAYTLAFIAYIIVLGKIDGIEDDYNVVRKFEGVLQIVFFLLLLLQVNVLIYSINAIKEAKKLNQKGVIVGVISILIILVFCFFTLLIPLLAGIVLGMF